jgi:hypothetical protein
VVEVWADVAEPVEVDEPADDPPLEELLLPPHAARHSATSAVAAAAAAARRRFLTLIASLSLRCQPAERCSACCGGGTVTRADYSVKRMSDQ